MSIGLFVCMPETTDDKLKLIDRRKVMSLDDETILKLCQRDWDESDKWFVANYQAKFQRFDQIYHSVNPISSVIPGKENETKKRADIFYPLTKAFIDTMKSILMNALFPSEDFFDLSPSVSQFEDKDVATQAQTLDQALMARRAVEDLLKNECAPKRANLKQTFDKIIDQALRYPWAVFRVGYVIRGKNVMQSTDKKRSPSNEPAPDATGIGGIAQKIKDAVMSKLPKSTTGRPAFEIVYDEKGDEHPDVEMFESWKTRPDPKREGFDNLTRFFMDEFEISWSWVLENEYDEKKNPEGLIDKKVIAELKEAFERSGGTTIDTQTSSQTEQKQLSIFSGQEMIKVRRWRNQYAEFLCTADFKILLRKKKKHGWDVCKVYYKRNGNSFGGICLIEELEKMNHYINSLGSSRMDNINLAIDGFSVVDEASLDQYQEPEIYSGAVVKVIGNPHDKFAWQRAPDVTQTSMEEIKFMMAMMAKICGLNENALGQLLSYGNRTATESENARAGMEERLKDLVSRLAQENLQWALERILLENMLKRTDEYKFTVLGKGGAYLRVITPEVLSMVGADVEVIPIATQFEMDRQSDRLVKMEMFKFAAGIPPLAEAIDWIEAGQMLFESARVKGIPRILNVPSGVKSVIPPDMENLLMANLGVLLSPQDGDDDEEHLESHNAFKQGADWDAVPEKNRSILDAHILVTQKKLEEKSQMQITPGMSQLPPTMGMGGPQPMTGGGPQGPPKMPGVGMNELMPEGDPRAVA